MAVSYIKEGSIKMPALKKRKITRWIKDVAAVYGKRPGDITYIFCDDEYVLSVNRQYLQHDYYTDIITFDYTEENIISGDIFISLDTVKSNADDLGLAFEEELLRIIIHGILHLCGINDKTQKERKNMTMKENDALLLIEYDKL